MVDLALRRQLDDQARAVIVHLAHQALVMSHVPPLLPARTLRNASGISNRGIRPETAFPIIIYRPHKYDVVAKHATDAASRCDV
jgi:hypothetical protein